MSNKFALSTLNFVAFTLILFTAVEAAYAESPLLPGKLAIYYGFPSLVNGSGGNINAATDVFNDYDIVVFGNGLQDPGHPDHIKTKTIINKLKTAPNNTAVYGYIPIGITNLATDQTPLTTEQIVQRVSAWHKMGAAGIFLDQAGYDFGVARQRQNEAVDHVHNQGLSVFINAWVVDDIFSSTYHPIYNPTCDPTHLGKDDIYLHEGFQIIDNNFQDPGFWVSKSDQALDYKNQYDTRIATVTTVLGEDPRFYQDEFDYAWWSTLLYGFDAMGWGEFFFSASDNRLPFRPRPNPREIGHAFTSPVIHAPPVHTRTTTAGVIEVNTDTHIGRFIPDSTLARQTAPPTQAWSSLAYTRRITNISDMPPAYRASSTRCLAVTKQIDPTLVQAGAPLTYTFRVTNTSGITLNATITDILPSHVTPTGVLTWMLPSLAPGDTWTHQFVVSVETGFTGLLNNKIQVATAEGPIGIASAAVCANVCKAYLRSVTKPCCSTFSIIEVENCNAEECCRLGGFWRPWDSSEFSSGRLIHNEKSRGESADSSKLFLMFRGTGVVIIYRQDTWYGRLRAESDDDVKCIDQKGAVKNQAEAYFGVDGEGCQSLILSGSKDTGVATVDAIKLLR